MDAKTPIDTDSLRAIFSTAQESGNAHRNILEVDFEKYQHFLDDSDLSDAQKREFLETIWSILLNFVDLDFGIHPMQQVTDEEEPKSVEYSGKNPDNATHSKKKISEELTNAAKDANRLHAERTDL